MITTVPAPGWVQKPGSAQKPFFGVQPAILNPAGEELEGACEGLLAIKAPWPSALRSVYNNKQVCVN